MARLIVGHDGGSSYAQKSGAAWGGKAYIVWSQESGGTRYTDLVYPDNSLSGSGSVNGSVYSGGVLLTSTADGSYGAQLPDGLDVPGAWLEFDDHPVRVYVEARQADGRQPNSANVGVVTFQGRTGPVTLTKSDVTGTGLGKADVGLGNVDNTADASKPVSTAQAAALAAKEDAAHALATFGAKATLAAVDRTRRAEKAASTIYPGGSWCWFNSPSVIDYSGTKTKRYLGWTNSVGDVVVASQDLTTGDVVTTTVKAGFAYTSTSAPSNDHSSPGICIRPDGRIMVFYALQGNSPIYYKISTNPEDISAFGAEQTITAGGASATYPHPHYIGSRLFLFYTSSPQGRVIWTDDNGDNVANWSAPQLWLSTAPNPGMYWAMRNNGSRIDYTLSMHPNSTGSGYAALSSMYHGYFDGTSFRASDGTVIGTLAGLPAVSNPNVYTQTGGVPVTSHTKVYDYTTNGLCWAWDVTLDGTGNPVTVFASYPLAAVGETYTTNPDHFTDHRYNYYRWNGTTWSGSQITPAGTKVGDNYILTLEYQYSGGIAVSPTDARVVFLSRQVAPSMQFEIERWVTPDGGTTWTSAPVTRDSAAKQFRPLTPHNPVQGAPEVVWLNGSFSDYTVFDLAVQLTPPSPNQVTSTALALRPTGAGLTDLLVGPALGVNPALLLPLSADASDISGNSVRVDSRATPAYTQGRYGNTKALSFDGTTQCLHTRARPFTAGAVLTFFGWAKRTDHVNGHTLFGSDDSGSPGATSNTGLRVGAGNQSIQFWANFAVSAGAGSANWANAWPGDGVWAHWALIVDQTANTVELFINGVSKGQQAYSTPWGSAGNFLEVGHYANFLATTVANPWKGAQALFGYCVGALTPAQIAGLAGQVTGSQNGNPAVASILKQLTVSGAIGTDQTTVGTLPGSRTDLANTARNVITETTPIGSVQGTSQLASGEVTSMLIGLNAGDVVTGSWLNITVTGSPVISLFKVGLFKRDGTLVAVSADISASITASGAKSVPFTAPYTVPTSGGYYAAILTAYTVGNVLVDRSRASSALNIVINAGAYVLVRMTGQTDMPSAASWASGNTAFAQYHVALY